MQHQGYQNMYLHKLTRYLQDILLKKIPKSYKDNIKIISQSIFGTRGYSIGHYAKLVRADVLIMNASETKKTFLSKFFPKDLDYILRELPTNVLIIQNTN